MTNWDTKKKKKDLPFFSFFGRNKEQVISWELLLSQPLLLPCITSSTCTSLLGHFSRDVTELTLAASVRTSLRCILQMVNSLHTSSKSCSPHSGKTWVGHSILYNTRSVCFNLKGSILHVTSISHWSWKEHFQGILENGPIKSHTPWLLAKGANPD